MLATVARPYEWWKIALIGLPLVGYGVIFTTGVTQRVFKLDSGNLEAMAVGTATGLIGAAVIEALWWILQRATGERRPYWLPKAEREAAAAQRRLERKALRAERAAERSAGR